MSILFPKGFFVVGRFFGLFCFIAQVRATEEEEKSSANAEK